MNLSRTQHDMMVWLATEDPTLPDLSRHTGLALRSVKTALYKLARDIGEEPQGTVRALMRHLARTAKKRGYDMEGLSYELGVDLDLTLRPMR